MYFFCIHCYLQNLHAPSKKAFCCLTICFTFFIHVFTNSIHLIIVCISLLFQIPYQGNRILLETVSVEAQHNSISDVICPFPKLRKKRSTTSTFITGFKIAVSNDGKAFSPSHFMYILDSTCQDTMNVSGEIRFALKVTIFVLFPKCLY